MSTINTKPTIHPFKHVRRAGVPISFFETPDAAASIVDCCKATNGKAEKLTIIEWDCARAITGTNMLGKQYANAIPQDILPQLRTLAEALAYVANNPPLGEPKTDPKADPHGGVLFVHNAHKYMGEISCIQSIWNVRDIFKGCSVSLVLLGCSALVAPELRNDIPIFTDKAPNETDILRILDRIIEETPAINAAQVERARVVDGCLGYLSNFNVEQSIALAVASKTDGTIDYSMLWDLKIAALRKLAGLEITLPTLTFDDLRGSEGIKRIMRMVLGAKQKPRAFLWLDEIEKMFAGEGDLTGTSQAIKEQFLYWTASRRVKGILALGIPGSGKSYSIQCAAGEAKIPLLRASFSSVKGGIVGQSEGQMSALLAAVDAIAQDEVVIFGTCNSLDNLSPEIMARFGTAQVFYDYPTGEEQADIWTYNTRKYSLQGQIPPHKNWVGREIEACCRNASDFNVSLAEAAQMVVPVAISNASKMEQIRRSASGKFLSAAKVGTFEVETAATATFGRKIGV